MTEHCLRNRRILVVEDEYLLATELEERLAEAGVIVVGPATSVEAALATIDEAASLDGAILDMNLGGEMAFPVADRLEAMGVPFIFATGYSKADIPARYAQAPRAPKPVDLYAVGGALARMLSAP